ncbi:hypothetical protein UlMin_002909 [Ulmus minor]
MAFDQNSIPKDLRPLNIVRSAAEEPRIVPATTAGRSPDGFFPNSAREMGSPDSIPVFYPAAVPEAGFVGLGYGNAAPGVAAWCPRMPVPVAYQGVSPAIGIGYSPTFVSRVTGGSSELVSSATSTASGGSPNLGNLGVSSCVDLTSNDLAAVRLGYNQNLSNRVSGNSADQAVNDPAAGFGYSLNVGYRVGGNGADQASEEGGDDSVSGKKVKFLCSFGGKILPRPSDGVLRYVGGHTRIISVRRDVSFRELVQKMVDTYGQAVVIKYQLPDEDLDALVSVSCPDDLDNMMEEYEKLVERSSDGSAKLRVFLFAASELDSSGMVQFGDLRDGGQRYVDAVNGIGDGGGGGGGIARKESIASATSTQNSDFSGSEPVDCSVPSQGDVTGPLSTGVLSRNGNSVNSDDNSPRVVYADPKHVAYTEAATVPLRVPVVKSGPPLTQSSQPEVELDGSMPVSVPQQPLGLQQPGMEVPAPTSYVKAYVDPRQEVVNQADYRHLPPQMGFPNPQLLGTAGPIYSQQQFHGNAAGIVSHQFIPAVGMTMNPSSSHVAIRPNVVQPIIQPQQARLDNFVDERTFPPRVVQLPVEQSYNPYQVPVTSAVAGGGYGWHQVPTQEHVVYSDRSVPHQKGQRDSIASPFSDSNAIYHSLRLDDHSRTQPIPRVTVTGAIPERSQDQGFESQHRALGYVDPQIGNLQPEARSFTQNPELKHEMERINLQQVDNIDLPRTSVPQAVIGRAADVLPPNTTLMSNIPLSRRDDTVQQHHMAAQYLIKQDALNRPVTWDVTPLGGPVPTSECLTHESPKEYSDKYPVAVPKEDIIDTSISYDQMRPIEGRMEALRICPTATSVNKEHGQSPVNILRVEDSFDHKAPLVGGVEVLLDKADRFETSRCIPTEALPVSSSEAACVHTSRVIESYEVAQPPIWGNPVSYAQPKVGVPPLGEAHYGDPAFPGVDPTILTDRGRPPTEWNDEMLRAPPRMEPTNLEALSSSGNMPSSFSPSSRAGDVQDSSNSLFSNQDPWNLRHDTQFPPPRPHRVPSRKEILAAKDSFGEDHLGNSAELNTVEVGIQHSPGNSNKDHSSEHSQPAKGSAEEQIKQELQAVAEGVAASVFQASPPSSNPDANDSIQDGEFGISNADMQHKAKVEDVKTKVPEKSNLGFPISDGIGRLQIIKNTDLEELKELGSGTFGTVYHGKWRGTDVAIKRINDRCFAGKASEQERMRDDFWNEAIKLADLHHPNVLAFYGVVLDGPDGSVATVTEYMVNGSLRNALQKNERSLDKRKRLLIAMDVAFGMEYLHGKNIVHFDLKSDNLLVNLRDPHRPICKVGDLGLSKVKCQTLISGGVRGTLPWMAPELLNGSSSLVSEKVDVFSFGIVLWELLTGEEPYADLHYGAIIGGIVSNTLRPPIPETCDLEWKSLMERCWGSEPSERPSFIEIANQLRAMAAKIPPRGHSNPQQQSPTSQLPVQN